MNMTIFTLAGQKKETCALPESLYGGEANVGLAHQYVVLQQSNRRRSTAHAKTRGEVRGSTAKVLPQKGTGRARRGSVRSPLLRGGGKAFGPRKERNFSKRMPKKMRRAALRSCLKLQARKGMILGLETPPEAIKTQQILSFLGKAEVEVGRRVLFVLPEKNMPLSLSARNIPGVKSVQAAYLNPEDVLSAYCLIYVADAVDRAEKLFGAHGLLSASETMPSKATIDKPPARRSAPRATRKEPAVSPA